MMRLGIIFRFIKLLLNRQYVWVIYEIWKGPGRTCNILGVYLDHEEMSNEYDRLRYLNPDKSYGVQMTYMKR